MNVIRTPMIFFALMISLTNAQAQREVSFEDGFSTNADCYGGRVFFQGKWILDQPFPGNLCSKCCGGAPVRTRVEEYDNNGRSIRCVVWDRIGRNDDISTARWFVKVGSQWLLFGQSEDCSPSSMPQL
jgi:hypothetical protein